MNPLLPTLMLATATQAYSQYVGDIACRRCHPAQYTSFRQTGMARSLSKPGLQSSLREFAQPARIAGKGEGQLYRSYVRNAKAYHASDAGETHELVYTVGSDDHGRSYVVAKGESLFLSPLSYYSSVRKWDLSPGYAAGLARDFTRPVSSSCLACHSSLPRALAIGCESCHGPGEAHAAKGGAAIVNPAKLARRLRDDVCNQCHLSGDIRIPHPGKSEADFRPGMFLDDVVAIFSVPAAMKRGGSEVLGQAGQIQTSRCWTASDGKMGCISCHDPHRQPHGAEGAVFFRSRCLKCHTLESCKTVLSARRFTVPADNCISCHMPQSPLQAVAHTAHTDHRILRDPAMDDPFPSAARRMELVYEVGGAAEPDLRSKALAYAEAAKGIPALLATSRDLLAEAARSLPDDVDIHAALGLSLSGVAARKHLERALTLGSKWPEVRRSLATLLADQGELAAAEKLLNEAIRLAPYDAASYLQLAKVYAQQGRDTERQALLNRLRAIDPANPELR